MTLNTFFTAVVLISTVRSIEYFISESGIDDPLCGNETDPCGSLYAVSLLINKTWNEYDEIYIIDGQNDSLLMTYFILNNTNSYDPCLPIPFDKSKTINITFNP
eukprot:397254_1